MSELADLILASDDLPFENVPTPEWKTPSVRIRTLSAGERDAFEQDVYGGKKAKAKQNVRAKLAVLCVVDASGKRVFNDDQAAALGAKSSKVIDRIFTAALKLNGIGEQDAEDLEKN